MRVDIWSDVMCPFCYIGKRKFEAALSEFSGKDDVEVVWHSFQLSPDLPKQATESVYAYLSRSKGISEGQARQMTQHVTGIAREVGLDFRFDEAVNVNSFDAHRLSHLAAAHGLQDAVEERLFQAYFTDGLNIADADTLVQIGTEAGLPEAEIRVLLASNLYADAVEADIRTASRIGVRGVPFFVLDQKYAVSGAQAPQTFLAALNQAYAEQAPKVLASEEGDSCAVGEEC